jgi:uncharacterized protein (DUF305 family)
MKNKFLIYSLAGLLGSVAVTGLADSIQAQSPTASENSHPDLPKSISILSK